MELKVTSLFKYLQDIAVEHSEKLGVGKKATIDIGLNWVIARFLVTINRMPRYQETVDFFTYPGETVKFLFPRKFEIRSKDGELLVQAASIWLVIDSKTRQPSMNPFDNNNLPFEKYDYELPNPGKIRCDKELNLVETRNVRYSDIDLNGHVNNTRYIDYILDTHDVSFFRKNKITKLLINYNKELRDGDVIDIYSSIENDIEYISGKVNNTSYFDVEITYEKRV